MSLILQQASLRDQHGRYSWPQVYQTLRSGSAVGLNGYHFSRLSGAGIYILELPSVISLPVTFLFAFGTVLLARQWSRKRLALFAYVFLQCLLPWP